MRVIEELKEQFQSTHPRGVRLNDWWIRPVEGIISIHAPTWGATQRWIPQRRRQGYFNPRTHVGCDSEQKERSIGRLLFQSTHPRGVRLRTAFPGRESLDISIHAPTWGATLSIQKEASVCSVTFQSTHPRGVRPNEADAKNNGRGISIHAPTWGATHGEAGGQHRPAISIHAPTWGATREPQLRARRPFNFNPRTHVGCDLHKTFRRPFQRYFNPRTHVGCDLRFLLIKINMRYFNPRTHVGCDSNTWLRKAGHWLFQSTHPRGVRLLIVLSVFVIISISIHAPTWGATRRYPHIN